MAYTDCASITLAGIAMDCSSSIGGIKTVYLARYADVKTVTVDGTSHKITTITLDTGARWYEYQFRKNTGSLTNTLNVNEDTGNNYITSELSLIFSKMETAKRMEMAALTAGAVVAVVVDANGLYWYLGKDDYVSASAGTGETGTAKDDRNAYTITLSTDATEWPYELDATAAAAVVASANPVNPQ